MCCLRVIGDLWCIKFVEIYIFTWAFFNGFITAWKSDQIHEMMVNHNYNHDHHHLNNIQQILANHPKPAEVARDNNGEFKLILYQQQIICKFRSWYICFPKLIETTSIKLKIKCTITAITLFTTSILSHYHDCHNK